MTAKLKPGYKQTEVGTIPDEWDVARIGDLGTVVRGGSPRPAGDPRYFNGTFIPWLTVAALTNISEDQLCVSETVGFLTEEGASHSRMLENDTLIIANSGATLGVAKLLGIRCCANDGIAAIVNQRAGNKGFVCHYINSITAHLRSVVATGNGQPNLNTKLIRNISIPFPPENEQRRIAAALSDVDVLLAKLDALIAKKRDLKEAAMQQLLTGRTRLPGFGKAWEVKQLGDLLEKVVGGGTPSRTNPKYWGNEVPWVTVKDFATFNPRQAQESITREGLECSASNLIPRGTLITSTRMALGKAMIYEVDVSINQDLKALFPRPSVCTQFLYYWFAHQAAAIDELGSGSTVKGISLSDLRAIEFHLATLEEQTAIATILSDMDAEITALEARRDKTRDLKQGMMQELLTGRIRLVGAVINEPTTSQEPPR